MHGATAAPALSTRSARPAGGDHRIDIERVRVSVKAHLYSNRMPSAQAVRWRSNSVQ